MNQINQTYPEIKTIEGTTIKGVQRPDDRTDRSQFYKNLIQPVGYFGNIDLANYHPLNSEDLIYIDVLKIIKLNLSSNFSKELDEILNQFYIDPKQHFIQDVAAKLKCCSYIIVYQDNDSGIWRYNTTKHLGWKKDENLDEHIKWMERLRQNYFDYYNINYKLNFTSLEIPQYTNSMIDPAQAHKDAIRNAGYGQDVDFLGWELVDEKFVYSGLYEITKRDLLSKYSFLPFPTDNYLDMTLNRFRKMQGRVARDIASKLGCKAHVILYQDDCEKIWKYNLTNDKCWQVDNTLEEHLDWHKRERERCLKRNNIEMGDNE
jgi:hypothetical protein